MGLRKTNDSNEVAGARVESPPRRKLQRGQRVLIWKEHTIQWIPYLHESRTREPAGKEIEPTLRGLKGIFTCKPRYGGSRAYLFEHATSCESYFQPKKCPVEMIV